MNKKEKAIYYNEQQVKNHDIYLWGSSGQKVQSLKATTICKLENSENNAKRVIAEIWQRYQNKQITKHTKAFDCSGLQIKALQYAAILPEGFDDTANGLMHHFTKVSIKSITAGDLVYRLDENGRAVHVAMYIGNGCIIEAKGRDYGVVKSRLDSSFTEANRPDYDI